MGLSGAVRSIRDGGERVCSSKVGVIFRFVSLCREYSGLRVVGWGGLNGRYRTVNREVTGGDWGLTGGTL